jgi:hypothetical protein
MKLSYWGIVKEKEFNKWLDSFDINHTYTSCKINHISGNKEYELLLSDWDLIINWSISYKEYHEKFGGCLTKIYLSTCENGFSHKSRYIKIEKSNKKTIKITTNINDEHEYQFEDNSLIVKELDNYMNSIDPKKSVKFIRDKKIKKILE